MTTHDPTKSMLLLLIVGGLLVYFVITSNPQLAGCPAAIPPTPTEPSPESTPAAGLGSGKAMCALPAAPRKEDLDRCLTALAEVREDLKTQIEDIEAREVQLAQDREKLEVLRDELLKREAETAEIRVYLEQRAAELDQREADLTALAEELTQLRNELAERTAELAALEATLREWQVSLGTQARAQAAEKGQVEQQSRLAGIVLAISMAANGLTGCYLVAILRRARSSR